MTLVRCEYCQGRKEVPCPECEGRGMVREEGSKEPEPCPGCRGTGLVECQGCLGTGFVDMPTFA